MIELRPFTEKDYGTLIGWIDNAEILMQFSGPKFIFPLTTQQLKESEADEKRFSFVAVEPSSGDSIGHSEIYLTGHSALLGRIIIGREEWRGKGLGKQIVDGLLKIAFTDLDQNIAELNVFDWNVSAIKCYERCGFVINLDKTYTREINGKTWQAINMVLNRDAWLKFHSQITTPHS